MNEEMISLYFDDPKAAVRININIQEKYETYACAWNV